MRTYVVAASCISQTVAQQLRPAEASKLLTQKEGESEREKRAACYFWYCC